LHNVPQSLNSRASRRATRRALQAFVVLACALSITGCSRIFKPTCVRASDFAGAQNNPPLKVPPGLHAPDMRAALPIPALNEPERPRAADEGCLDAPPRYAIPKATKPAA
jgi:uncharacterized lipoprotein